LIDLSIIIPCYNEEKNVPKIQQELWPVLVELYQTRSVEVVFVDDGSADQTWQALREAIEPGCEPQVSVKFLRHEINRGLGAAIRTGFAAAGGRIIVTTDSDGTYHFSEIPTLLSYLKPGIDAVTASPYHPHGSVINVPVHRLILSRGSSMIYRFMVDRGVYTYTALFRAYRRSMVEQVPFDSNGHLACTEILVNGMFLGFRVVEYPTVLHARAYSTSKIRLTRTILAHLVFQARVLRRRLSIHKKLITSLFLGGFSKGFREITY
jgi:dolichol-phosphate mannosyltransferase